MLGPPGGVICKEVAGEELGTTGVPDKLNPTGTARCHQIPDRGGDGLRVDSVPPALSTAGVIDEDEVEAFSGSCLADALHMTVRPVRLRGAGARGVETIGAIAVEIDDEALIASVERVVPQLGAVCRGVLPVQPDVRRGGGLFDRGSGRDCGCRGGGRLGCGCRWGNGRRSWRGGDQRRAHRENCREQTGRTAGGSAVHVRPFCRGGQVGMRLRGVSEDLSLID